MQSSSYAHLRPTADPAGDLRDYLVERFGVQQATRIYGFHQLLVLQGPDAIAGRVGPERYGELVTLLREAGLEF